MGNCWRKRSILTKVKNEPSEEVFVVEPGAKVRWSKNDASDMGKHRTITTHLVTQQFGRAFSKEQGLQQITTHALSNSPQ
jgi:hypothetical protein